MEAQKRLDASEAFKYMEEHGMSGTRAINIVHRMINGGAGIMHHLGSDPYDIRYFTVDMSDDRSAFIITEHFDDDYLLTTINNITNYLVTLGYGVTGNENEPGHLVITYPNPPVTYTLNLTRNDEPRYTT